jgi:hypothetical protein
MFYTWIHSVIIISKKTKDTTKYERVVMIAGLVAFILFMIGSNSGIE